MKNTKQNWQSQPQTIEATDQHDAPPVILTWTRTITEEVELRRDPTGLTIGERVDNLIRAAIMEGQTVQTIALEIEPQTWAEIRADFETFGQPIRSDRPK